MSISPFTVIFLVVGATVFAASSVAGALLFAVALIWEGLATWAAL